LIVASGRGVQAEVLLSLALVMVTATALLAATFVQIGRARIEALHEVLGQGFVAEAALDSFDFRPPEDGLWWRLTPEGRARGLGRQTTEIDEETRRLAGAVREAGHALVASGAPWAPIRFAAPGRRDGEVVAGRIEPPVSGLAVSALVAIDVLVFGLFGFTLMQRRLVAPLRRLAGAVRQLGDGGATHVPIEGAGEVASLARAFNETQDALAARTGALEKAVRDLRTANANLVQARDGLDRAERLAMVGSLAAGVAHEVGNPMGALLAFLEVASRDDGLGHEGRRCLERAMEQGERVRGILRQLLDFSRPPRIEHAPVVLGDVARQVVDLVSAQKEFADIEFEVRVAPGTGPAMGDASVAAQILLNLALNAAAAMRHAEEKRLRFEIEPILRRRRADDTRATLEAVDRADAVVCHVADSGPGVALESPERIFDPFFTTKDPGEGTGLGLANARRLAQELGGSVELDAERSALGGALFHFVLDAAAAAASSSGEERERTRGEREEERGGGGAPDQSRMP
jgi:signal transduction histidine kinase